MVEFFCCALKHQAYSPCRLPGTRKCPLTPRVPVLGCGAEHRGPQFCHWEESQSLGQRVETISPRKAQHPTPAASRRANLCRGQVSSGKERGSSGRGVTDTPLLFKGSLGFRGAVALTCLCQEPTAGLGMAHCSPPWSWCLHFYFLSYQLLLPAPRSVISDAGEQLPVRQT